MWNDSRLRVHGTYIYVRVDYTHSPEDIDAEDDAENGYQALA